MNRIRREYLTTLIEESEHIRELNQRWAQELEPKTVVDLSLFMKEKNSADSERQDKPAS